MNKEILMPITVKERIQSIDVIRGLAILGIFLVNLPSFYAPMLYLDPEKWWSGSLNQGTNQFIDIFAQASFYTLFSFLFGFGMVIFKERAIAKGYSYYRLITRRLLVLLIIGCIHAFLIWHGDILISYAIVGAIMILFHKAKPVTLLIWSLLLIFIPSVLISGLMILASLVAPEVAIYPYDELLAAKLVEVYSSGSFAEITLQRIEDWYYINNLANGFFLILTLLPMFLLGAFIAKSKWFENTNEHLKKIRVLWLISLVIGLPTKLAPYLFGKNLGTDYIQDTIGGPATAILYATSIVLLVRLPIWNKILSPLAAVGRLSMSNYLFQSFICTLIFYSYGLGFYNKMQPFTGTLLAVGIFIVQIFLSKLWIKRFRYGPVEWLWRTLTYGQKVQIKK
ncbi:DUF418 domain-containing protein [Ferdinandcohnia quinoae]|uniref:DUF418 domain-containing protein n=1 Tax=Fredinandcohnia quinoae TaxID=2918902 RepID=A0AAW5DYV8_9BACI|nr:DUF418 domain-containing protein [Fredinandcohnia sp. SECRCQ15]MCH1625830.1 DUF418 domain-containing protein [Fredinandcohnia sp. SECRCQ15]